MADIQTFVIAVSVMADEFQRRALPPEPPRLGRRPALTRAEVLTPALVG